MKKTFAALLAFLLFSCAKENVVIKPVPARSPRYVLAGVSSLKVPRILKVDQKVNIEIAGFFDKPGYVVDNVEIKRKDNEIVIKVFGKLKTGAFKKTFTKYIILPPQRAGEYDVIVYGKNKHINDIIWVEEYRDRNIRR